MSLFDSVSGLVITGGALANTLISEDKAADARRDASKDVLDLSKSIFQQTRQDVLPQIQLGQGAANRLSDLFLTGNEQFASSPESQFVFDRGVEALDRSAASRGRLFSGAQGEALTRFGQGNASQDINNQFNRLAALSGIGGSGASTSAGAGANFGSIGAQALTNAGDARASGFTNAGSGINQSLNNLVTLLNRR